MTVEKSSTNSCKCLACQNISYNAYCNSYYSVLLGNKLPPERISSLARSAKLPTGLYILLALITFFFFFSFLMIAQRQIISGSAEPIFAVFAPNDRYLFVDDRSGPLF